jgi:hypothetical protein
MNSEYACDGSRNTIFIKLPRNFNKLWATSETSGR